MTESVKKSEVKLVWAVVGIVATAAISVGGMLLSANTAWATHVTNSDSTHLALEKRDDSLAERIKALEEQRKKDEEWRRTVDARLERILCAVDKQGCLRR